MFANQFERHSKMRSVRHQFAGYTLLELTIVLAILTTFAVMSWPVLMKPWQKNEVKRFAESIREALIEARVSAITEGIVYEFRWKANANEYEVVSRDPIPPRPLNRINTVEDRATSPMASRVGGTVSQTRIAPPVQRDQKLQSEKKWLRREQLPNGLVFFDARAIESAFFHDDFDQSGRRKEFIPQTNGRPDDAIRQRQDRIHAWRSLKFYPDGRSENQVITLRSEEGLEVDISVRGLTAGVTISPPRRIERQDIDLNHLDSLEMESLTAPLNTTDAQRESNQEKVREQP